MDMIDVEAKKIEEIRKPKRLKFQRHVIALTWKSYLQRIRRWRILVAETIFAFILLLIAVFIAKPVFLTPLQTEPEPPLTFADLLASVNSKNLVGYAPNTPPYVDIMARVAGLLRTEIMSAATEDDLNNILYNRSKGTPLSYPVIWVIWSPLDENMWKFRMRSTERARYATLSDDEVHPNPHLRVGFLGVQVAVSQAILEFASQNQHPFYELSLVSMPVSPLMEESRVRRAISGILLCLTLALILPVIEAQSLVVAETQSGFKRSMRMRNVDFSSLYLAWLVYAYLTVLPICLLGAVTLILIFRWIHLVYALITLLAYVSVMIMLAFIMAMFHTKIWIARLWSILFTLLQTFLAELLVHHHYDLKHEAFTFVLHVLIPPMGLVNALNEFALLQIGQGAETGIVKHSLVFTILSWGVLNLIYFGILMLMQRTMRNTAIGGPVSWKSIIFKKAEDKNKLNHIPTPTGREREKLQEVDELVAKAISFRSVSKNIMKVPVLSNITLDIYRGEFTMLFAERIQEKMIICIEDLLTGLTQPDEGTINVLGQTLKPETYFCAMPNMVGYCHNSRVLIQDLTVEEHINLFADICLWQESTQYVEEFVNMRMRRLLQECNLSAVLTEQVRHLGQYFHAQLSWAIALLLEPRVIFIPNFTDKPHFIQVLKDKIMRYKKYATIVFLCYASINLEYADRLFIFDSKVLVFGGTPAYMFFKYGREYRVRMTFRHSRATGDENTAQLLRRATAAGATVRAHLGSLLILRLPASPTENVAALVKDLSDNADSYGITSMNISLPDCEEVSRRIISEARAAVHETSPFLHNLAQDALKRIKEPCPWTRTNTRFVNFTQIRNMGWKFASFYLYYKTFFVLTLMSTVLAGVFIGISLSRIIIHLDEKDHGIIFHAKILTVEARDQQTTLVLRSDSSMAATSVANAYVLSDTKATAREIADMEYTALSNTEDLTEYLATRAIDSPQQYVYMYAYGMDVCISRRKKLKVQALYSPIHQDEAAAARSLARVYMALLRHYTDKLDASIQVTDDPLELDLTPWMKYAGRAPLLIQFLLILTISHITLIPSKEFGIVRHLQCQAMDFSPARYWLTMYLCDGLLYWLLVMIITTVAAIVILFTVPFKNVSFMDLAVIPTLLFVYGLGCIPQAYLFSIGPQRALNTMTFVIVNIVFGETTVVAKLFYGSGLDYALYIMRLSPQFNMAYGYVKVKQIFLYNSECVIVKNKNLCAKKILHKCCEKCGVLQECFKRRDYFTIQPGILVELISILATAVFFIVLLMLWEYRLIQRAYRYIVKFFIVSNKLETEVFLTQGAAREKADVQEKLAQIESRKSEKVVTYGEYLLASNVSKKALDMFILRDIYLGLGKGEVLALSGLKRHGRLKLCEILAGYKIPHKGEVVCMSKWRLKSQPYLYARNVSLCCEREPLPQWMKVYDALRLIAVLRGVPRKHVGYELQNYIDALELHEQAKSRICDLLPNEKTRLHFAAAVVGAPPVLVLDECTAYQKYSVRRAMYSILYMLRKRGHAIFISSSNVESHLPVTNRLAFLVDGHIYDTDSVDALVARYSNKGYTVVVHLKDELEIHVMFERHFQTYVINDVTEVLVNIQVLDNLSWAEIFEKMELLQAQNPQVYSYIVSAIPIDYIYNSIITSEQGLTRTNDFFSMFCIKKLAQQKPLIKARPEMMNRLKPLEKKYDITKLKELPWSVIFQR